MASGNMDQKDKKRDLEKRIFDFVVDIIKFLKTIKRSRENDIVVYQLSKAATSVGANYEESQGAYSKEDFNYKISICYKESRETNYWLRVIKAAEISKDKKVDYFIQESFELKSIFASMLKKIHKRKDL
ncbi:MAG: four helix bundle protein [Candidatus Cloacimonadota bacterium]|nr:MAG: four helix bundle protein [Candidatus Cloacimonadota bacterium]